MSMRIDEAGQDHASAAVDLRDSLAILLQPRIAQRIFCGANRDDLSPKTEHRSVLNDSEFGKGSAAPRAVRSRAQREKLADVDQQQGAGFKQSPFRSCRPD